MKELWTSLRAKIVFTLLLGFLYPFTVTLIARTFFEKKSGGGLIERGGKIVGSELLAQEFKQDRYFWPRPSAIGYNPIPSGAANLGPTSKALLDRVEEARKKGEAGEMLYASASGLDPHLSPAGALMQIDRVAKARGVQPERILALVKKHQEGRQFGFLGEERVNVLMLNLDLDTIP